MQQCNACHGIYAPTLPDGTLYFHVCPPLSVLELKAALANNTLTLNASAKAAYDAAVAADVAHPPAANAVSQVDALLSTLIVARQNARNENVTRQQPDPAHPAILSEGAGMTTLPPAAAPPAATLT